MDISSTGFRGRSNQARVLESSPRKQGNEIVLVRVVVSDDSLMKRLTGAGLPEMRGDL